MSKIEEQNWEVMFCMVCAIGLIVAALVGWSVPVWRMLPEAVRSVLCALGTLASALGLWICAWECGRRFEREHGDKVCGCRSEDEVCGVERRCVCKADRGPAADAAAVAET